MVSIQEQFVIKRRLWWRSYSIYQVPVVTEGEAFHECIAFMINVIAPIRNAVAMQVLNTFKQIFPLFIIHNSVQND